MDGALFNQNTAHFSISIYTFGNKTIEIANIDIKKQYTIFYGEFRYCLILHFDKKTTSFFLPNDCFKWFLAGNNDKITCIHDGKAAFILFSECL